MSLWGWVGSWDPCGSGVWGVVDGGCECSVLSSWASVVDVSGCCPPGIILPTSSSILVRSWPRGAEICTGITTSTTVEAVPVPGAEINLSIAWSWFPEGVLAILEGRQTGRIVPDVVANTE